jgi:hypothetical protein
MSRVVIGITGYAQHGKNTVAEALQECIPNLEQHGFADALRKMASALNPIVTDTGIRYNEVLGSLGYESAKAQVAEFRHVLQRLGTEAVRGVLGDDAWVDALDRTIQGLPPETSVVVTDVRFPNEADYIKAIGQLWSVTRLNDDGDEWDNGVGENHASERWIPRLRERADVKIVARTVKEAELAVKAECWGVTTVQKAAKVRENPHIDGWYACSCIACVELHPVVGGAV